MLIEIEDDAGTALFDTCDYYAMKCFEEGIAAEKIQKILIYNPRLPQFEPQILFMWKNRETHFATAKEELIKAFRFDLE